MTEIKEITSIYQGSVHTYSEIKGQIAERFGQEAAEAYNPTTNCFTFNRWIQEGYKVKKGEKALRTYTYIKSEKTDVKTGEVQAFRYPKGVCLFYIDQVEKIEGPKV